MSKVTLIEWRQGDGERGFLIDRDCLTSACEKTISELLADKLAHEWNSLEEGDTIVIRTGWEETPEDVDNDVIPFF